MMSKILLHSQQTDEDKNVIMYMGIEIPTSRDMFSVKAECSESDIMTYIAISHAMFANIQEIKPREILILSPVVWEWYFNGKCKKDPKGDKLFQMLNRAETYIKENSGNKNKGVVKLVKEEDIKRNNGVFTYFDTIKSMLACKGQVKANIK